MSEPEANYTTVTQPFPYPSPLSVEPYQPRTFGIDVSRWQDSNTGENTIDYHQCFQDGVKFVAIRCTAGDYYTDPRFAEHWDGFGGAGILRTPYIVVAPAWSASYGYHPVGPQAHWERFREAFGDRQPDLPIVLDCELSRGMSPDYISDLYVDLIDLIYNEYGRMPLIYTRGNWWNENTRPRAIFGSCDLWIARYNTAISHPWEDNDLFKPRDWDEWYFWQWSEEYEIEGIPDSKVDADWFNGALEDLLQYAELEEPTDPDPVPCECPNEERIDTLEKNLDKVVEACIKLEKSTHALCEWAQELEDANTDLTQRVTDLENAEPAPEPEQEWIWAKVKDDSNCSVYLPVGHDKACEGQDPPGKPIFENKIGVLEKKTEFRIYKEYQYSCKDDPNDPWVIQSGGAEFGVVYEGPFAGGFAPRKKFNKI